MKYALQILGTIVISPLAAYALWRFFEWLTPIIMGVGWVLFILILVFGLASFIIWLMRIAPSLIAGLTLRLLGDNTVAKVLNVLPFLYFGYFAVTEPFRMDMQYGLLQWIEAIFICAIAFTSFWTIISAPFTDNQH